MIPGDICYADTSYAPVHDTPNENRPVKSLFMLDVGDPVFFVKKFGGDDSYASNMCFVITGKGVGWIAECFLEDEIPIWAVEK